MLLLSLGGLVVTVTWVEPFVMATVVPGCVWLVLMVRGAFVEDVGLVAWGGAEVGSHGQVWVHRPDEVVCLLSTNKT